MYQLVSQSVQSLSCVQLFVTPWTAACQTSVSITNSWSLLKLMSIESVMPSSHLILCHPLLLLPSVFPSIRVFSSEAVLSIRWLKYWSSSFSISSSNEHPGLISFRIDWLDLLAVQRTLKSLLQHHSSKASILWRSAFFIVQLSHSYMTTGKAIALTRRTFVTPGENHMQAWGLPGLSWQCGWDIKATDRWSAELRTNHSLSLLTHQSLSIPLQKPDWLEEEKGGEMSNFWAFTSKRLS